MKLSIITINYNNKAGLEKTIASVMHQSWRDFEWILIDGGSTDGSKEVIESLDANVSYWCSEKDNGVYNAINKGIAKANGKYHICMNSGDIFYDDNTLKNVFSKAHNADIVYGDWMYDYGTHETLNSFPYPVELMYFYNRNICHQAMFVKTEMLKKKGFDETYKLLADWARWVEAKRDGASFEYLGFCICHFEIGGMSNSTPELHALEIEKVRSLFPPQIAAPFHKIEDYQRNFYVNVTVKITAEKGLKSSFLKYLLRVLNKIP